MTKITEAVFTVVDTETTGPDPAEARCVQLGLAVFAGGQLKASGSRLCDPGVGVPLGAYEVHGISDVDLIGADRFVDVWRKSRRRGAFLCGYNSLGYDWPVLRAELARARAPAEIAGLDAWPHVDVMAHVAWQLRGRRSRKLGDVCASFDIRASGDGLHAAHADCEITGRLLLAMVAAGLIPDDAAVACEQSLGYRGLLDAEFLKYSYWFYDDRVTGQLRVGCSKYSGQLAADVPKSAWRRFAQLATDQPPQVTAMLRKLAQ